MWNNIREFLTAEQEKILSEKNTARINLKSPYDHIYFTAREADIVLGVLHGLSTPQIAINLSLSPRTVESYLQNIKHKTHSQRRDQLVRFIIKSGFIDEYQRAGDKNT